MRIPRLPHRLLSSVIGALACAGLLGIRPAIAAPVAMDGLVKRSLEQVPSVKSSQAAVLAQRARVGVASAAYWPQVAANAGYVRSAGVFPATISSPQVNSSSAGLALRQLVWNFGKTDAQVDAATANLETLTQQARLRAIDVAYGVRLAYLQWAEARGVAASHVEQVRKAQRLLDQANHFFKAGVRSRIDVTRAEVAVARAKAALVTARLAIDQARRSLETASGGQSVDGEPFFPEAAALTRASASDITTSAMNSHPTILAGKAQLATIHAASLTAERAYWPDVNLDASGGARVRDTDYGPTWQAGVTVGMPVFNGFALSRQQEAASESERAAGYDLEQARQQVALGVDRAYISLAGTKARLAADKEALRSAQENHRQAESRYRAGVGSIIEESDAQALLAAAEADLTRSLSAYALAVADLQRAAGLTGLES
ncbi:MAG: TolC family protein [Candidatus Sericytochromatia bacterium]|nr:TolC family protein [Candidatus Sericytochromatia bacterium]